MTAPRIGDFEYKVFVQVYLPRRHAELLRTTALNHYDLRVRECGDHGAINGLYNVALWTAEREALSEAPSVPHALDSAGIDTARKAMEQARPRADGDVQVILEIRETLWNAWQSVQKRWCELSGVEYRP